MTAAVLDRFPVIFWIIMGLGLLTVLIIRWRSVLDLLDRANERRAARVRIPPNRYPGRARHARSDGEDGDATGRASFGSGWSGAGSDYGDSRSGGGWGGDSGWGGGSWAVAATAGAAAAGAAAAPDHSTARSRRRPAPWSDRPADPTCWVPAGRAVGHRGSRSIGQNGGSAGGWRRPGQWKPWRS